MFPSDPNESQRPKTSPNLIDESLSLAAAVPALARRFAAASIGRHLLYLPVTTSTSDEARAWLAGNRGGGVGASARAAGRPATFGETAQAGWLGEAVVVVADEQTAGRGRSGRGWTAPPGTCLLVSIGLRVDLAADCAWLLGAWLAVAAAEAIEATTGLSAGLKWPNDLLLGGRKAGGILVETTLAGDRVATAILGLGLNVNLDAAALAAIHPDATSLAHVAGRPIARPALLAALLDHLNRTADAMDQAGGPPALPARSPAQPALRQAWERRLVTLGQPITVHEAGASWPATAVAVADDGGLVVETPEGERRVVYAADVSIRSR